MTGERLLEVLELADAQASERFDGAVTSLRRGPAHVAPADGVFALRNERGELLRIVWLDPEGFEHHVPAANVERLYRLPKGATR